MRIFDILIGSIVLKKCKLELICRKLIFVHNLPNLRKLYTKSFIFWDGQQSIVKSVAMVYRQKSHYH